MERFLTEKFLFWLEVLSVIGAVREAVDALEATAKWLDVRYISLLVYFQKFNGVVQESPTLTLARDYSRFVITFSDLISTSASHIYISALPLSPQTSMVHAIYGRYARPLVRVVHGLQTSWEPVIATIHHEDLRGVTAWSPCNRFIAVVRSGVVEIRDAVTFVLLNTLKSSSHPDVLEISTDSRLLTQIDHEDRALLTWDLQTGGSIDAAFPEDMYSVLSSTYSMDGKLLAVAYSDDPGEATLVATHDLSTTRTHRYRVPEGRVLRPIWTHHKFLRFATAKPGSITIWEVEFTLTQLKVVESFPAPDEIANADEYTKFLFLPTLSRLAVVLEDTLSIWDIRDSRLLLNAHFLARQLSFSSDGRFFACTPMATMEVRIWKECPTGYVLHQKLATIGLSAPACLSPNGESILISPNSKIHLRHTRYDSSQSSDPENRSAQLYSGIFPRRTIGGVCT